MRSPHRTERIVIVAQPTMIEAAAQVVLATRAASPRPVRTLSPPACDRDASEPGVSVLGIGSGPLRRGIDRTLVLATDPDDARRLAEDARRFDAPPATIELTVAQASEATQPAVSLPQARAVRLAPGQPALLHECDAAWLGRHLSRTKLGLALGAGGAWGFAHLGVLQVLAEAGYAVDAIAGTSVGAVVGGLLAMGLAVDRINDEMRQIFDPAAAAELFRISLAGSSSGRDRMVQLLRHMCQDRTLEELEIPLSVAVIDLRQRRARALTHGPLWQALAAATALPGLYPPWEHDGERLVDAFAVDPLPARVVTEMNADVTVAIDLLGSVGGRGDALDRDRGAAARLIGALTEVLDAAALEATRRQARLADVLLRPAFPSSCWRDVALADDFLAAGRDAALQQLPALGALASPNHPPPGGADV